MTMSINATGTNGGTGRKLGWLVWWTIHQEELDTAQVADAAKAAGVPQGIVDRISGRTDKSAWAAATQLGAKGRESSRIDSDPAEAKARFLVRDIKANASRAIVREINDADGERVSSDTVAQVYYDSGSGMKVQVAAGLDPALEAEVKNLCRDMKAAMGNIIGRLDHGRIRALLTDWLEDHFRITVRGTGGVYLVPRPRDDQDATALQGELVALSTWITAAPVEGLFSIVEVSDTGATTLETFVKSAIQELKSDLEDIDGNLAKWAKNANMNDGSKMFSADAMMVRLDGLADRTRILVESLGEEIAVMDTMLQQVTGRARAMRDAAMGVVSTQRESRNAEKAKTREEKLAALKASRDAAKGQLAAEKAAKQAERAREKAEADAAKQAAKDAAAAAKAQQKAAGVAQPVGGSKAPKAPKTTTPATANGQPGSTDDLAETPKTARAKKQGVSRKAPTRL